MTEQCSESGTEACRCMHTSFAALMYALTRAYWVGPFAQCSQVTQPQMHSWAATSNSRLLPLRVETQTQVTARYSDPSHDGSRESSARYIQFRRTDEQMHRTRLRRCEVCNHLRLSSSPRPSQTCPPHGARRHASQLQQHPLPAYTAPLARLFHLC